MDITKSTENSDTTKRKRERSVNFTEQETNLLLSLVQAKKYIIECKKSDATTWQEKEKAWKEIEKAFHSLSGSVFRDQKHLKIKYEAIKRDTRKKIALAQEERSNNDGGASTTPVLTPAEYKVMEIIHSVDGNESFDPDVVFPNFSNHSVLDIQEENSEPSKKEVICEVSPLQYESDAASRAENQFKQWKEWNPTAYKTKKHHLLSKPKEKRLFSKLMEEKIEIAKIQKKILTEELEQKCIQRKNFVKELENKSVMHELEKQHLLLKIELLKKQLANN